MRKTDSDGIDQVMEVLGYKLPWSPAANSDKYQIHIFTEAAMLGQSWDKIFQYVARPSISSSCPGNFLLKAPRPPPPPRIRAKNS